MNRALGTDGTINLAIISLESEGKERVGLKRAFWMVEIFSDLKIWHKPVDVRDWVARKTLNRKNWGKSLPRSIIIKLLKAKDKGILKVLRRNKASGTMFLKCWEKIVVNPDFHI